MTHSLSYQVVVDKITGKKCIYQIEATEDECEKLIERLKVHAISQVKADLTLQRKSGVISIVGTLTYDVVQECVVTLDPVPMHIETEFEALFYDGKKDLPEDTLMDGKATDLVADGMIDLGEVITEQISLTLPDFPKAEGVGFADHIEAPEVLEEPENRTHRPFAKLLQGLKASEDKDD